MSRQLMTIMVMSVGLALLAHCRRGEARVRLNSVRTVILQEAQAPLVNRSWWEPSIVDVALYQCMSDLECSEGSYCHAPARGPAHSRCRTCHRRNRRCRRDGMCCPGNRCSINVCVPDSEAFPSHKYPNSDAAGSPPSEKKGWRRRGKTEVKVSSSRGQVGAPCLRSSDCSADLCCARHFWTRICKPVLMEGQVCTRQRRKGHGDLELFQRCPCGDGLSCKTLRDASASSSSSSSSSLLLAAKSKFFAPPSSSSSSSSSSSFSHPSAPLSSKSSSTAAKARLHVCQKN